MEAVLQVLQNNFKLFGTEAISLGLVCIALLFWLVEREQLENSVGRFVKYEILIFILIANPFGYNNISTFWMQEDVYWKVFLMLLPVIMIAFPIAELTVRKSSIWKRAGFILAFLGMAVISMNFILEPEKLVMPKNAYKVTEQTIELDSLIREAGVEIVNMIAPREVCAEIREINGNVNLLYGEDLIERMIDKTAVSEDEEEQRYIEACTMIVAAPDEVEHQLNVADVYGSNCIVLEMAYDDEKQMTEAGFHCYGRTDAYALYYREG